MKYRPIYIPIFLLSIFISSQAKAERLWLIVGENDFSAEKISLKAKNLYQNFPESLIVKDSDCGEKKENFFWAAKSFPSAEEAKNALPEIKKNLPNAYIKACNAHKNSLASLKITAVDQSISDAPSLNWQEENRISTSKTTRNKQTLIFYKYFSGVDDNPFQGANERVYLIKEKNTKYLLENSCFGAKNIASSNKYLAFQCNREQAADNILHGIQVFDTSGKKITEINRCRNPAFANEKTISCKEEIVDSNGELKLRTKNLVLPL